MLPESIINLIQSYVTEHNQCCFFHDSNYLDICAVATLQDILFHSRIKIISINQYEWERGYSITYKSHLYQDYAQNRCKLL